MHTWHIFLLCDLLLPARSFVRSLARSFAHMKTFHIASNRKRNVLRWRMMMKALRVPLWICLCGAVLMEMLSERKLWRKCLSENDVRCDMQTIKFKRCEKKKARRRTSQQKIISLHKSQFFLLVSDCILESTYVYSSSRVVCLIIQY